MTPTTMPSSIYASRAAADLHGYTLLDADLKAALTAEYGHMATLGGNFEQACEVAEDRYAFTSPLGYVIAFDPQVNEFVAFASVPNDIRMIQTSERGVFDAIVDEARDNGDDVHVADGIARISSPLHTTIAVLAGGE